MVATLWTPIVLQMQLVVGHNPCKFKSLLTAVSNEYRYLTLSAHMCIMNGLFNRWINSYLCKK
jgi:hypothetical protein